MVSTLCSEELERLAVSPHKLEALEWNDDVPVRGLSKVKIMSSASPTRSLMNRFSGGLMMVFFFFFSVCVC